MFEESRLSIRRARQQEAVHDALTRWRGDQVHDALTRWPGAWCAEKVNNVLLLWCFFWRRSRIPNPVLVPLNIVTGYWVNTVHLHLEQANFYFLLNHENYGSLSVAQCHWHSNYPFKWIFVEVGKRRQGWCMHQSCTWLPKVVQSLLSLRCSLARSW